MPVEIPRGVLIAAGLPGKEGVKAAEEWCLSTKDFALLVGGTQTQNVSNWATSGRGGWILPSRRYHGPRQGGRLAFRLQDVELFAQHFGWMLEYTALPIALQRRYRVGEYEGVAPETPEIESEHTP